MNFALHCELASPNARDPHAVQPVGSSRNFICTPTVDTAMVHCSLPGRRNASSRSLLAIANCDSHCFFEACQVDKTLLHARCQIEVQLWKCCSTLQQTEAKLA